MAVMQGVYCGTCGAELSESPSLKPSERQPCPSCESKTRRFDVQISLQVKVRTGLGGKHKRPGRKKPLAECFTGWQVRKSVGDHVNKDWLLDRENDRYKERVVTEDGEVLRDVDEPLSAHRGRGSAKFKKAPDRL